MGYYWINRDPPEDLYWHRNRGVAKLPKNAVLFEDFQTKSKEAEKGFWLHDSYLEDHLDAEYSRGYKDGVEDKERVETMEKKVDAIQHLLNANARVLREQIEEDFKMDLRKKLGYV